MNQKQTIFEDNLQMNYNLVKCCSLLNVTQLIGCLSTCIYPDKIDYPIYEDDLHQGPPHQSNDAYAYAKRMMDFHCDIYRKEFQKQFINIIPTNIYGPEDNFHLDTSHVIPALIHKAYIAKQTNKSFTVFGDGSPLRQFIYVDDVAFICLWIIFFYSGHQNLILAGDIDSEISIHTIASIIHNQYQLTNPIIYDTSFSNGQYKKTVSNQKLRSLLPSSFTFTSLEEGLLKTIDWFTTHYPNCRI